MTFVEARPALKDVRGVLFDRAVQELLSAYPTVTGRRRQYVGAVASFHAAHRPAGFRFPGGAKGLRPQLIGGGKYTALGALDTALATRRTLRSAPAAARAKAKKQFTKRYYAAQRKLPSTPGWPCTPRTGTAA